MTATVVRPISVADLFCGAGGSSEGLARACDELGVPYTLTAVNHWDVAIASHTANHPYANHLHAEVDRLKSGELSADGRLDILWASPSCSEHSYAKGGHGVDDQNRVSAWAINREIERYRPAVVIVENVPPFRNWGPVERVLNPDGSQKVDKHGNPLMRPIKARRGETFRAWFASVESMGYEGKWALINSADHGEPQTRIRWFGIFTLPGVVVPFPEPSHAKPGTLGVDSGDQLPWVGAREIIDWSLRGTSIFERDRPLSPNTMRRIEEGIRRYCSGALAEAFIVVLRNHADAQSINDPAPTITAGGTHVGLAETDLRPFIGANRTNNVARGADEPVAAVTTATGGGLFFAEPFVCGSRTNNAPKSPDEPLPTVAANSGGFLVEPFVLGQQEGAVARDVEQPLPTVTGGGYVRVFEPMVVDYAMRDGEGSGKKPSPATPVDEPLGTVITRDRFGIAEPFVVEAGRPDDRETRATTDPLGTVTGSNRYAVAEPIIINVCHGDRPHQPKSLDDPLGTVTAKNGAGMIEPFIVPQQGDGTLTVDDPLDTITTTSRGKRLIEPVAEPFLTSYYGDSAGGAHVPRSVEDPVPTITTANRFGLVQPYLVAHFGERPTQTPRVHSLDDPAPAVTHRGAGDLVEPVVEPFTVSHGGLKDGQENVNRTRSVDEPIPTATASGAGYLAEPSIAPAGPNARGRVVLIDGKPYQLDVRFRMLQPHELAAAQGFPAGYIFTGTKEAQTAQIGNAVPVGVAKALLREAIIGLGYGVGRDETAA